MTAADLKNTLKIVVYCGSRFGNEAMYRDAAVALGTRIGELGATLVFGGGKIGLMGVVADSVMAAGGIMPRFLVDKEQAHRGLDRLEIVSTMHERKARMIELGDHFVALPGGVGTLEEIYEVLSWRHLALVDGSVSMYNVGGFYDGAAQLFERVLQSSFLPADEQSILTISDDLETIAAQWKNNKNVRNIENNK